MKTVFATLALLSAAVVSRLVGQGDNEETRRTLAGLKGMSVVVTVPAEAQRDGADSIQVRTDVELRLRQAGIAVHDEQPPVSKPAENASLFVNVLAFKHSTGIYAFYLTVELRQDVMLIRNPPVPLNPPTWSTGYLGVSGSDAFARLVRDRLRDLTDQFLNAYLAANPKR